MAKKQKGELTDENSTAIFPQKPEGLRVETVKADMGFLAVEVIGEDAGRILFDRRPRKPGSPNLDGKLRLWFNQTVFAVNNGESKKIREQNLAVRKLICEKLGAIDATKD